MDVALGSISIPPQAIADTIQTITAFITEPSRKHTLRDWQRLAGWLNWVLNVFSWGRPALTELYRKMRGKSHLFGALYLNRAVIGNLT